MLPNVAAVRSLCFTFLPSLFRLQLQSMTSSPPPPGRELAPFSDDESQLSSLLIDLSQNMQLGMDNMLKMINEIDQNSAGILEEIEKSKESVFQRKRSLEEEKDHFQKAAFAVLDMLNSRALN